MAIPMPGLMVKGCLDDCNVCEPELKLELAPQGAGKEAAGAADRAARSVTRTPLLSGRGDDDAGMTDRESSGGVPRDIPRCSAARQPRADQRPNSFLNPLSEKPTLTGAPSQHHHRATNQCRILLQQQRPLRISAGVLALRQQVAPGGGGLVDQLVPAAELRGPVLERGGGHGVGPVVDEVVRHVEARPASCAPCGRYRSWAGRRGSSSFGRRPQQFVDAGLAAGLLVDLLDDDRRVKAVRAVLRRQVAGDHHAAGGNAAVADFAAGAVVDAG